MSFFVYGITDVLTGDVVYIGKTINPDNRWRHHRNGSFKEVNYDMSIIIECESEEDMCKIEKQLIIEYKPKENITYIKPIEKKGFKLKRRVWY